MPKSIIFILIILSSSNLLAQNETQSTLFWNNYTHFNPAMTGVQYKRTVNAQWRNQWTQVNGAPTTLWANYTERVEKFHGAVGVNYRYETIGFFNSHTALATYAFHIPINKSMLSIGSSAGVIVLDTSTYALSANKLYKPAFKGDFGITFRNEKWNLGLSITSFNSPKLRNENPTINFTYHPITHLTGEYTFAIDSTWKIIPGVHFFTDQVKIASITSIRAQFKEVLWFGINSWNLYSSNAVKSFGGMVGYDLKQKFRIGYSLEFYTFHSDAFFDDSNITHEIVLSYLLK